MKNIFKIIAVIFTVAIFPITVLAQTPRITSPSNNSSSVLGNDINVYVSGNNIEVIYAGLNGNPNPSNSNESSFYKGTMYQSGNRFYFTPNTSTWENKWVKIIAHDKVGGGWSDPVYVKINPKTQIQTQTKQTLTKPQWIQKLPSSVIANQEYTISWTSVANAQKYRVYFTQGGKDIGWDYLPTGTSQTVKIPDVSGSIYIGITAIPSDYNKYNQSSELQMSFTVTKVTINSINADRWTNQNTAIYSDWNQSNRKSIGITLPKGTKVNVRDKFTFGNEAFVLIWTYNREQGNYSGNMYINANHLTDAEPQQPKQALPKPQWIQRLPSTVIANQDYTISWSAVTNAQKYRVYFTQGGKDVGWDYLPTGTSQTVKIPDVSGSVYIGIIAMPSDYNKYNQSSELQTSFTVMKVTVNSINADRWTNQNTTVYNDWNQSNRKSIGITLPKGTRVNVRDKFILGSEEFVEILTYNREQGSYSGKMYINVKHLTDVEPQQPKPTSINFTAPTSPQFKVGDLINIAATITKGSEFMHYNVYIKRGNTTVWQKERNTDNQFQITLNTNTSYINNIKFTADDYTIYIVPYKTDHREEDGRRETKLFKLINPQELTRQVDENGIRILQQTDYESVFKNDSFHKEFAYWCGKVSNDAYGTGNKAMSELGFKGVESKTISNVKYDISYKQLEKPINDKTQIVMIAIRGTSNVGNWATDLIAYPVIWKTGKKGNSIGGVVELIDQTPEVHGGFFTCAEAIWNQININSNSLYIITGHSLGGAIAELISLHLSESNIRTQDIICYGFASPPVGDGDLLRLHAQKNGISDRIHKIHNTADIIPKAGWNAVSLAKKENKRCFTKLLGDQLNHSMGSVYLPKLVEVVKGSSLTAGCEEATPITTNSNTITQQNTQPQTYNTSNFTKIGNASVANHAGKSFIGMINATSGFRFTVNSTTAKTVTFSIVYRSDNRNGKLIVNGAIQNISFPSTNWNWGTKDVQVSLRQGANTIEFYGGYPTSNDWAPDIAEVTIK